MNCVNFESIVADLVRNQMAAAGAREQALLHSSSCRACATRLQEEQALTQGFQKLSNVMREEFASGEIEARLAVAFREYHAAPIPVAPLHFGRSRRRYWHYAVAAGILLAITLGITARFWDSTPSADPEFSKEASSSLSTGSDTALPDDFGSDRPATVKESNSSPRVRPVKRAAGLKTRVARYRVTVESLNVLTPAIEVTTEFIPIGYANAVNVQEGGQVVRLEMPRYAMSRFGLPINEERYAEMVKADVWVGADGLARAIRFVQ